MGTPQIIGCFSVDTNRAYEPSPRNCRYFRMPGNFPLDLKKGHGSAKKKPDVRQKENIDLLLEYISRHRDELLNNQLNTRCIGDFISTRGTLRKIMCTPYEERDDWCILATKFKGSVYFCGKDTDRSRLLWLNKDENHKALSTYGFKFEQYCLTTEPGKEPNTDVPVDECEEFSCVYNMLLGGIKLFYGAEVDGVISDTACSIIDNKDVLRSLKLVELKTSLKPGFKWWQRRNFLKYKCRTWWCQSFLAGIQDIMVGYRTDSGLVHEIEHMKVDVLPRVAADYWSPSQCADFLIKFLQMVQNLMKDVNCPYTVYEFYFDPHLKMISYRVFEAEMLSSFLPEWYITKLTES